MAVRESLKELYDEWYFEEKYRYSKKRKAIRRHALNVILWANKQVDWNITDGKGMKALDVGCAYGFVTDLLSEMKYDAVGIDVSTYAVKKGHEYCKGELLASDASRLPFKSGAFNLVTCFEVLEHLPDPAITLAEIHRVLRDNGLLIATTPNANRVINTIIHIAAREREERHVSIKPPAEWIKAFSKAGFSILGKKAFLILPSAPVHLKRYFSITVPPQISSNIILLAAKK